MAIRGGSFSCDDNLEQESWNNCTSEFFDRKNFDWKWVPEFVKSSNLWRKKKFLAKIFKKQFQYIAKPRFLRNLPIYANGNLSQSLQWLTLNSIFTLGALQIVSINFKFLRFNSALIWVTYYNNTRRIIYSSCIIKYLFLVFISPLFIL